MAHTAFLVCFISTVNGHSKKEKKPIMSCASSRHISKLKQSIFVTFDIYEKISLFSAAPSTIYYQML